MPGKVAVYNGAVDSGGAGACNTPPFAIGPAPGNVKVLIGGLPPILEGDVLTPAPGTTPGGNPCTTPRTATSTSAKGRIGGRRPCSPGDILAATSGTPITITPASASPKVTML